MQPWLLDAIVAAFFSGRGGSSQGGGSFNPATLNLTSWERADFAGIPWPGVASAGISGTTAEATMGADPTAGTAVDGHVPAHYTTTSQTKIEISGSSNVNDYITPTAYTFFILVKVNVAGGQSAGSPYVDGPFMTHVARWGCSFGTNGIAVPQAGVWHYTPTWLEYWRDCSVGVWHFICVRYDGTNVQIDIDNSPGAPSAMANPILVADLLTVNLNAFTVTNNDSLVLERGTSKLRWSDTDRDNYYSYLKARYPSAGLP